MDFLDKVVKLSYGIKHNYDFGSLSGYKTKGIVKFFAETSGLSKLQKLLKFAVEGSVDVVACGHGSNILIHEYFDGLFIRWTGKNINMISVDNDIVYLKVESGVSKSFLIDYCIKNSLSGLEFWAGIPGLVGGGVAMNAGAHGREISDYISNIEVAGPECIETVNISKLKTSYRNINIPKGSVITSVVFKLKKTGDPAPIKEKVDQYIMDREAKHPLYFPSCGSVFKNPAQGKGAWQLIKESGLHDLAFNDAKVSLLHSNFIVNVGEAKSEDILSLITYIRQKVKNNFHVELEPEVRVYGNGRLFSR